MGMPVESRNRTGTQKMPSPIRFKNRPQTKRRRGSSTVELAVCLPVIFLICLGAMEGASMIFLRQALVQSAYETVKASVRVQGSEADGLITGRQVLDFRNIENHTITFDPSNVDDLERGTPVTVTVTAPGDSNTVFPFGVFRNRQVTVQATMLKE